MSQWVNCRPDEKIRVRPHMAQEGEVFPGRYFHLQNQNSSAKHLLECYPLDKDGCIQRPHTYRPYAKGSTSRDNYWGYLEITEITEPHPVYGEEYP